MLGPHTQHKFYLQVVVWFTSVVAHGRGGGGVGREQEEEKWVQGIFERVKVHGSCTKMKRTVSLHRGGKGIYRSNTAACVPPPI